MRAPGPAIVACHAGLGYESSGRPIICWKEPVPLLEVHSAVIGVEIGGRGQRVVVADGEGRIVGRARSIDAAVPAHVALQTVRGLIDQACASAGMTLEQVARVGVAFGGPVDVPRGLTLLSHRAEGYENFPIVNLLEEQLHLPVVLDNSARSATLGEAWYGAARGARDVIYVHLGTGVGGGLIVGGRLVQGAGSTAGEIGHMVVSSGGPICSCGKPGHLEAYASAPAIVNRFRDRLRALDADDTRRWAGGAITTRAIFSAAGEGDVAAQEVADETVRMLGLAIANLITILNPAVVVVGGAVADAGEHLMSPLSGRVRQYAYPSSMRRARLALSQLGADATVLGAVALALSQD